MDDTPAPIPRRIVFRALADVLEGQSRLMRQRTKPYVRPGHAQPPQSRIEGRALRAQALHAQADTIAKWVADPGEYQGAGLDAAVFGYLIALTYGNSGAIAELKAELSELGRPGILDGFRGDDVIGIVGKILDDLDDSA